MNCVYVIEVIGSLPLAFFFVKVLLAPPPVVAQLLLLLLLLLSCHFVMLAIAFDP